MQAAHQCSCRSASMAARRSSADLVALVCRRFFRSTLQPIAEHLEYNPAHIAARYRANYLGSISLPAVQQASYSAAPTGKPTREVGKTSNYDGETPDTNTMPAVGSQDKQGGGKAAKVREGLPCCLHAQCLIAPPMGGRTALIVWLDSDAHCS